MTIAPDWSAYFYPSASRMIFLNKFSAQKYEEAPHVTQRKSQTPYRGVQAYLIGSPIIDLVASPTTFYLLTPLKTHLLPCCFLNKPGRFNLHHRVCALGSASAWNALSFRCPHGKLPHLLPTLPQLHLSQWTLPWLPYLKLQLSSPAFQASLHTLLYFSFFCITSNHLTYHKIYVLCLLLIIWFPH